MNGSIDLDKYQYAVFDCDGVLLDSNRVKTDAFSKALEGEPDTLVGMFVDYHKANGGVSRYEKFEYYFTELKQVRDYSDQYNQALARYQSICKRDLAECAVIPGVEQFLIACQSQSIQCFVNSGGDEAEVNEILAVHKLDHYFKQIFGSPKNKFENMDRICSTATVQGRGVYFGDARSDMLAAEKFGLDFTLISGVSEWDGRTIEASKRDHPVANDFNELLGGSHST